MDISLIIKRIKNILITPNTEWLVIKNEEGTEGHLIKNFALPLILIMTVASLLGTILFTKFGIIYAFLSSLFTFLSSLLGMYISAIIINELGPSFNIEKNRASAFKLVIYSSTAFWVASAVAGLLPPLSFLAILGLYGIYLFWIGSGIIFPVEENKKAGYVIISFLIMLAVNLVLAIILGLIPGMFVGLSLLA